MAMTELGNGLSEADQDEDALSVQEAELSMLRRVGADEENIFVVQNNLAITYARLGRDEEALQMKRDVYSGRLELYGEEDGQSLGAARNYAAGLIALGRYADAKSWLRKQIPMASRVLGNSNLDTLVMKKMYARALSEDPGATLADLREAVSTLEETERTARRVLGGTHPDTERIEDKLQDARAALNTELRAAFKEDPSSLSADDHARAEQLLARDARKAAKKAARGVSSEAPSPGTA
jgi:hypothetical protein